MTEERTTDAWQYYQPIYEPNGSGEIKSEMKQKGEKTFGVVGYQAPCSMLLSEQSICYSLPPNGSE